MPSVKTLVMGFVIAASTTAPLYSAVDARGLYQAGSAAQAAEDYFQAIEKYKEAIDANPSYVAPMRGLAECFFSLEEYDEADRWTGQAMKYDRANADLGVLLGRIRIGQGDLKGARSLFQDVLSRQPNNLEARFGMAEADVAEGRTREALSQYTQTLKMAPESKKALLSLAVLSEDAGDAGDAARYFDLALRSHSDDPQVQLAAGSWYARAGHLDAARTRAEIALSLKPDLEPAQVLLGSVDLQSGSYQDAVDAFRQVVAKNRDNSLAWYGLGVAYSRAGDPAKSMSSFATGLSVKPEDEVSRIAQESVALDTMKMDDPQRKKLALYHLDIGGQLETGDFLERALAEYRRALLLDPTSRDARISYARIFRVQGFPAKYLNELEVLAKLGVKDTFVSDEIESLTSKLSGSLSRAWGVDQFALERLKYAIPVFTLPSINRLVHPQASDLLARHFTDTLLRYESIAVPTIPAAVSSLDEAFRTARERASDYYIVLTVDETERAFSASVDLYLSRTGTRIASFGAFRTGNDRIRDSFLKIGSELASVLPLRGTILQRKFDQGLVDFGSFQGIKGGDSFVVVRRDKVRLDPQAPGLAYDAADVVGTFTAQVADEGVSEGLLARKGYFDFMNPGDEVIVAVQKKTQDVPPPAPKSGNIITRLFGIKS